MKNVLFIVVIACFVTSTAIGQGIKQDPSCLKISNYAWYSSMLLNELKGNQTVEKRDEMLPQLEKLSACSKSEFLILKKKFPEDKFLGKVELWVQAQETNIKQLKGTDWSAKPMWQMASYLTRMELEEFVDGELCK